MIASRDAALLVIDAQLDFLVMADDPGDALNNVLALVAGAQRTGVPIVLTQEVHRAARVDFGRELDGDEPVPCLEGAPGTALVPELRDIDAHLVRKRRDSVFFGPPTSTCCCAAWACAP